ncbi:NUDIX domain-containing protein [Kitasatospora sp. NPDC057223]|uniref:NUDIX domain-containing protein n=1 Tax=Kitasatospora sp. NPDC057223 TaxID=3346055 RepID=UPI003640EB90
MDRRTFGELRRRIGYPDAAVPEERDWYTLRPGYAAVEFAGDPARRAALGWDDDADMAEVWRRTARLSAHPVLLRDGRTGRPLNPAGPTGIAGLGRLRRFGPNPTADGVVTLGEGAAARVLLVERRDTGQPAFPGGFCDPRPDGTFEHPLRTALREVYEETGVVVRAGGVELLHRGVAAGSLRNTDNAWIENTAYHVRLPATSADPPPAAGRDDALTAGWFRVAGVDPARMSDVHAANLLRLRALLGR